MSANIFGTRFLGNREPAWHGLGTVVDEPLTVSEAVEKIKANFLVKKFPVVVEAYGDTINTEKYALVREPTDDDPRPRPFGIVGPEYTIIQNTELAAMLDPLVKIWPLETIGVLDMGKKIFLTLYAGDDSVGGDDISKYFLLADDKGGGHILSVAFTPVRVVCQNTLVMGLKAASVSIGLRHILNVTDELQFQLSLVNQLQKSQKESMEALRSLTLKKIVESQVEEILKVAYPNPPHPKREIIAKDLPPDTLPASIAAKYMTALAGYEQNLETIQAFRNGAHTLYDKFNDEFPGTAGTAWALYNAVVETEDYRRGGNAQENAIFGSRAVIKARTLDALIKL